MVNRPQLWRAATKLERKKSTKRAQKEHKRTVPFGLGLSKARYLYKYRMDVSGENLMEEKN
ncbi:hypothetical protein AKG39_09645 [Acetobacterium bakii]|uniref:Uncharacterized protein n=1 Tax=Acetobacterium bakii TaxID=52689 RepID=A0A0L6U269_9FIRM|nr:hypothetical protein AKG39_09645 [Acetobacterium bakii]